MRYLGISVSTYPSLKRSFRRRSRTLNSKPNLQRQIPQYALLYPQLICYFHLQDFLRSSLKALISECFKALNLMMISTKFLRGHCLALNFPAKVPPGESTNLLLKQWHQWVGQWVRVSQRPRKNLPTWDRFGVSLFLRQTISVG